MDFLQFSPKHVRSTMLDLVNYVVQEGDSVEFSPNFWDVLIHRREIPKKVALKRFVRAPARVTWPRLGVPADATRIVVLAYSVPVTAEHTLYWNFLREAGVGLYHERIGWVFPPNTAATSVWTDLTYRTLSDYSQDDDGEWMKACRKCGEIKPLDEFYLRPSGQRGSKDPYRNQCKICMRGS